MSAIPRGVRERPRFIPRARDNLHFLFHSRACASTYVRRAETRGLLDASVLSASTGSSDIFPPVLHPPIKTANVCDNRWKNRNVIEKLRVSARARVRFTDSNDGDSVSRRFSRNSVAPDKIAKRADAPRISLIADSLFWRAYTGCLRRYNREECQRMVCWGKGDQLRPLISYLSERMRKTSAV